MADLEAFLHDPGGPPLLIALALAHYQFEAIHPFRDGNGRVGRALIQLVLIERGVLTRPLLYLSGYLERNRREYYDHLLGVSQHGDFASWIAFFLEGIRQQAYDAERRSTRLVGLRERIRSDLSDRGASGPAMRLADQLFGQPYVTAPGMRDQLGIAFNTAQRAIRELEDLGVLREVTGRQRGRVYRSDEILRVISEGS